MSRSRQAAFALVMSVALIGSAAMAAPAVASTKPAVVPPPVTITNFGITQTTAVNSAETSYPVSVHWTNSNAVPTQRLYRYDESTNTEVLVTSVAGTAGTITVPDALPIVQTNGDSVHYIISTYVANKLRSQTSSQTMEPQAFDDNNNPVFFTGTWAVKQLAGATLGHYSASSSPNATWEINTTCENYFGIVATTSPSGGTANLFINGTLIKKLSFKSSKTVARVLVYKTALPYEECIDLKFVRVSGQINLDALQRITLG